MKKSTGLLTIMLAIPFIGGCSFFNTPKNEDHQHSDANSDHKCDECGEIISEHLDSNNDHKCDVCGVKTSEHTLSETTHGCSLCGEIFPTIDLNIDGKCDYCDDKWSDSTKALFNTKLGELLPFFKTDVDFEEKPYYIEAIVFGDVVNNLVTSFTSTGVYTSRVGEYSGTEAIYLTKLSSIEDIQINVMLLYNAISDLTYVDAYTTGIEVGNFPINKVLSVLNGHTSETVIVPSDGTTFMFEKGEGQAYCMVTYNGDADAYLAKLVNAGYYVDYSMMDYYMFPAIRALSPGRTLAIQITDKTTEATIEFMGVVAPSGVAWSDEIKTYMNNLIEEVIPFANADFVLADNAEETLQDNEYFQLESSNIDAFKYAIDAMKSDNSWHEEYEEDGNFYTYTKSFGYCEKKVVISVLWSMTTISVMKVFPDYTSFPYEQIIYCIGNDFTDTIIEPTGDSFHLYYESGHEGIANLTVYGDHQDYVDYISALENAGYSISSSGDGWDVAIGPNHTIQLDMFDSTQTLFEEDKKLYKVEFKVIEPEEEFSNFPMEEFEEEMDDELDFTNVPLPTGETFVVSYPYEKGHTDIMLTITGGDKEGYTQAILNAGFSHYSAWDYSNYKCYTNHTLHIVIYIYDLGENSHYAVEFGMLIEL